MLAPHLGLLRSLSFIFEKVSSLPLLLVTVEGPHGLSREPQGPQGAKGQLSTTGTILEAPWEHLVEMAAVILAV